MLALILALMLILSLAACGGNDDKTPSSDDKTPSSSQQQEQEDKTPEADPVEDEPEETPNKSEEQVNTKTFEFPTADYIKDCMVWSGAGKVVNVLEETKSDRHNAGQTYPLITVYVDAATMDELSAYVDTLKANGFVFKDYEGLGEDLVYRSSGSSTWYGILDGESYVAVTLYENVRDLASDLILVDGEVVSQPWQLVISMSNKTDSTWFL